MKFTHQFQIQAPLAVVADFHAQADSMGRITPPPIITQFHRAPIRLNDGDEIEFTLWFGPLPLPWLARIEAGPGDDPHTITFTDRQLRGPFAAWAHRHTFTALNTTTTLVIDEIEADLSPQLFWKLVGLGMWLSLPLLFAYRRWQTQRLLTSDKPADKR